MSPLRGRLETLQEVQTEARRDLAEEGKLGDAMCWGQERHGVTLVCVQVVTGEGDAVTQFPRDVLCCSSKSVFPGPGAPATNYPLFFTTRISACS